MAKPDIKPLNKKLRKSYHKAGHNTHAEFNVGLPKLCIAHKSTIDGNNGSIIKPNTIYIKQNYTDYHVGCFIKKLREISRRNEISLKNRNRILRLLEKQSEEFQKYNLLAGE